jgi:hypothetical protein
MRESSFRRARLCHFVDQHEEAWLPLGAWGACADATRSIPDGADVVLAFDGSFSRDCTVLVAATVEDAIRAACSRWRVLEVAADPTAGSGRWKCSTATASRSISSSRPPPGWGR